ncbi:glycosyl hydrolase-related protein [Paenibacillus amylolyticus]|nr:glycosyl hydrolase-related protein [Paenibacillus amylolyticus]WFR65595.1 glycosyl hydrolase-related protein [Paenibacillus amylolyticus]
MVESIKKAEDSNDIIVRLYETSGTRVKTKLSIGWNAEEVWEVDLMENNIASLELQDQTDVVLSFTPFEIISLQFKG